MALRPVTFLREVRRRKKEQHEEKKAVAKEALELFRWRIEEDFVQKAPKEHMSPLEKVEYVRIQKDKRAQAYKALFDTLSSRGVNASTSQSIAKEMVEQKSLFVGYWLREFSRRKIATLADIKSPAVDTFVKILLVVRDMYASDDIAHLLPIDQVIDTVIDYIFSQSAKKAR